MKIAFDHQAFCLQTTGGISRYFCRLAQQLTTLEQEVKVFAPLYRNQYLHESSVPVSGRYIRNYPSRTAGITVSVNAFIAQSLIRRWKPDIVHETYFSKHSSGTGGKPTVLTVFDMISELEILSSSTNAVDLFKASSKYAAVSRADHIICISEHTQRDLINLFDVPARKTSVVYLGCDSFNDMPFSLVESAISKRPFLLYVGNRSGYKNFTFMLEAIASSHRISSDFDIVCFGGGPFSQFELTSMLSQGLKLERIHQISGNDQMLASLYHHTSALIYPSTYEGFGLPPLEAMSLDCPVISSNVSAMPEVIGDAGYYFDPISIDSLKNAIESVVYSESMTKDLIKRGKARFKLFTWDRCAHETMHIYLAL